MADRRRGGGDDGDPPRPEVALLADASQVPPEGNDIRASATRRPVLAAAAVAALWVLALIVTVVLVHQRYRDALSGPIGADFLIYLHAARLVASGHSPYSSSGTFVYPPALAVLLAPFVHAAPIRVFRAWTVLELAAMLVGIGAFVATGAPEHRAWVRPILFTFCVVTAFHFWPIGIGLYLGQADAFVFAALLLSAWAARRGRPATRGAFLGLSGLLKTWPAAVVVSVCQLGAGRRLRAAAAFVVTILVAPVLAVVLGGGSGLVDFTRAVVSARSQHLVHDSVWGAPSLLFSNSGLAHPVVVSAPLRVLVTGALVAWVGALVVVVLRTPGDPALCTWNVTFCIVLLLPVSHRAYALYGLPALWFWASRLLRGTRPTWGIALVAAVLFAWWVVLTRAWPDSGSSPAIGAVHYCVVFAADLAACTASVIGARFLDPRGPDQIIGSDPLPTDPTGSAGSAASAGTTRSSDQPDPSVATGGSIGVSASSG
jgi:hypothetical protein